MHKFKLARIRAKDIKEFLGILPPNAFAEKGLKTLKLAMNAMDDLAEQNKEHEEKVVAFNAKQKEFIDPIQKQVEALNKKKAEATEADKAAVDAEIQAIVLASNKDIEDTFSEEKKVIDAAGDEVAEFQLSDEKFPVVKEYFEEHSLKYFNDKKAVLAISDALDAAVKE